jgi:ferrochelatase
VTRRFVLFDFEFETESRSQSHHTRPIGVGVLLANLGSPSVLSVGGLRSFYAEFLADRRVIEVPRVIWNVILYGFILPFRPYKILPQYAAVWNQQLDKSPLLVISEAQRDKLQAALDAALGVGNAKVAVGMRYGEPSIASALAELARCERIVVLPLYPQPAAPTSASTFDAVADCLRGWRNVPSLRFVAGYADEPRLVRLLADSVRRFWQAARDAGDEHPLPDRLLISFHGVPRSTLLAGDPYHCLCTKTARLLADELDLAYFDAENNDTFSTRRPDPANADEVTFGISFQSRFGFAEWVRPYSVEVVEEWGKAGVERMDIIAPAFSADCLETLEEISIGLAETFHHAGGKRLRYIPALNDGDDAIQFYSDLVLRNMLGWPEQRLLDDKVQQRIAPPSAPRTAADAKLACQRAIVRSLELAAKPLAADVHHMPTVAATAAPPPLAAAVTTASPAAATQKKNKKNK